ncbi:MAG TPA: DUF5134 domain-containing protein [Streptosporangiaceae bacterium]|nr:DUF5134 domain-containing protein [Streptosporangiaceae bacterium]
MSIPDWLLEIFAGVTLLVAAMSAGQLAVARAWIHRGAADADITLFHLLLGIAMAGLLAADLHTLPNSAWDVVFAVTTAWFDWCLWRDSRKYGAAAAIGGQYAPQLTYSAAMLYMFTALAKPSSDGSVMSGMSGMPGQRVRLLPRPPVQPHVAHRGTLAARPRRGERPPGGAGRDHRLFAARPDVTPRPGM